jgi:hypothetical protein
MQVIQLNLNHCETAQQLLYQTASKTDASIAVLSDPYQVPAGNGRWVSDATGTAAIWIAGNYPFQEVISTSNEGFVIAKINGVYICSCYAPPRWDDTQFAYMVDHLALEMTNLQPAVMAGDFNAWATEWGSRLTNTRGQVLTESLARLNVTLGNVGARSTFIRNGAESIIDVTFCSPALMSGLNWRVADSYTHSDHQAIRYSLSTGRPTSGNRGPGPLRWKTSVFDAGAFRETLREYEP